MLRYTLAENDLGDIRFGLSPLCEMGLSLRSVREPSRYPLQLPWLRRTEGARSTLDTEVLDALIDDRLWTPDFLNPRPASPLTRMGDELDALRRSSPDRFVRQLVALHGTMPAALAGDPRRALARTADALEAYWHACFEPYWARMRTILEADIVYRGRQVAQVGLAGMLNGISPTIAFSDNVIALTMRQPVHSTIEVAGRGVTLVPTMFTSRASAPIDGAELPIVMYPARGQGTMWQTETAPSDAGAIGVLGATRAALLTALAEPASSTELGIRFGVSTSAINQHLRALLVGRLVTSTRYGHSMLYLRSELGSALLGL